MCDKYMGAMTGAQHRRSQGRAKKSQRRAKNSQRRPRSKSTKSKGTKSRGGGYAFDLNNQVACGRPAVIWQNDYFFDPIGGTIGGAKKKKKKNKGGNLDDRDFSCKQPVWGPQCLG